MKPSKERSDRFATDTGKTDQPIPPTEKYDAGGAGSETGGDGSGDQ